MTPKLMLKIEEFEFHTHPENHIYENYIFSIKGIDETTLRELETVNIESDLYKEKFRQFYIEVANDFASKHPELFV